MMAAMRWGLVAFVCCLWGCGPISYVNEVRDASEAIDMARAQQADKYAPYYWTRATQYLHKAREDAEHADFQGASRFGRLASEAAKKAIEDAMMAAKDPSKRPFEQKDTKTAPAKDSVAPAKDE